MENSNHHEGGATLRERRSKDETIARQAERIRVLEEALRGILLSADASWEEGGLGHDWPEAMAAARLALAHDPQESR